MKVTQERLHHALCGVLVTAMLAFAWAMPDAYVDAMQEDRLVEWATTVVFALAAVVHLRAALVSRRFGDGLVGLFCLIVAGEEISWGQRLLGFMPPAAFLEHNAQQELTLHNLANFFGQPKWVLAAVLLLYGVLLPTTQRWGPAQAFVRQIRLTVPPAYLIFWFALCAGLLFWYPVEFTGEWVELLASTLFLATSMGVQPGVRFWQLIGAAAAAAAALTFASARGESDPRLIACARDETSALIYDITTGRAANASLGEVDEVDKRMLSAADAGYFDYPLLNAFNRVVCSGVPEADARMRRRDIVDPWGTAYWLRTRRDSAGSLLSVEAYSFGPNRRRDGDMLRDNGDDIVAAGRFDPGSESPAP